MTDRRNFLKTALLPAGAFCLASAIPAGAEAFDGISARRQDAGERQGSGDQAPAEGSPLSQKLKTITKATPWTLIQQIKVQFKTFHCQGMARIGKDFWVSSVEISTPFDRNKGKGHLFKIDEQGNQLADIPIGEGSIYHPSGIDFDGTFIWIAAAEYRPDSQAIIYRFDPATSSLQEQFRWQDHIGGILHNTTTNTLHGISWGSRRWYQWSLDKQGKAIIPSGDPKAMALLNPSFYIDYQDNQYLGGNEIVYTGLNAYRKPDGSSFALGGFDIIDTVKQLPVHQVPVQLWSPVTGAVITQNPSHFELTVEGKVRAYFMPDDNDSTIFVYEA